MRNLEDIPDDIMDAAKSLILKQEEEKERMDADEFQQQLKVTLENQQNQIARIESQIQLLLQLSNKK